MHRFLGTDDAPCWPMRLDDNNQLQLVIKPTDILVTDGRVDAPSTSTLRLSGISLYNEEGARLMAIGRAESMWQRATESYERQLNPMRNNAETGKKKKVLEAMLGKLERLPLAVEDSKLITYKFLRASVESITSADGIGFLYDANTHDNPEGHYTLFPTWCTIVAEFTRALVYLNPWEKVEVMVSAAEKRVCELVSTSTENQNVSFGMAGKWAGTESPALPPHWQVRMSSHHSYLYYFNTADNTSQWEHPHSTDQNTLKHYVPTTFTSPPSTSTPAGQQQDGKIRAVHLLVKHSGSRRASSWK